jgi:GAF domain-containing protein
MTEGNTIPFAVPISLRGQVLGAAVWELPASQFSEDKVTLAEELVNRLAVSLDNARLFEESQRATARERLVNDIAAKITGQTAVDAILTTAVREVGQALQSSNVRVRLGNVRPAQQNSAAQLFGGETFDSAEKHTKSNGNGNGHAHDPSDE